MKYYVALPSLILALQACAPSKAVLVDRQREALPLNCPVKTLSSSDVPLDRYDQIAVATFGDTGFSLICDKATVHEAMRVEACRVGANALLLVHEEEPNWLSSCYRAAAKLVWLKN